MGFDFSKYIGGATPSASATTSAPQTLGALPAGMTQDDVQQMYYLQQHPVTNPDEQNILDGDGNVMGSMKDLNAAGYATQKAQWDEQQKLMGANLLQSKNYSNSESGSAGQAINQLGSAAPAQLAGHDDYHGALGTALGEGFRLDNVGPMNDSSGSFDPKVKMLDPSATYTDPNWGKLTYDANKNKSEGALMDTFWKVAPLIPGLIAGGVGMLGLSGAGGATAGDIAAGADTGGMFGAPLASAGASGGAIPSWMSSAIAKTIPNIVRGTISGLNSNNGKFDPLGAATSLASGAFNLPSWAVPLANAGVNLARGGSFDFSKYLPGAAGTAISQLAKGL